jgi:hypothetical protein
MSKKRFTREDLIQALHKLAQRVGGTPIEYDTYDYPDIPSHTIFVKRFGTWREALQAAGIPLNPLYMGYAGRHCLSTFVALPRNWAGHPA